ncbi:MAG: hypothetical protein L3J54_13610 [Draconibacterium sp.]|nr:hypothetical protein [Draconibacterium sp.]
MINLIITVQPKSIKYLEFSQTLEQIKGNLSQHCTKLAIVEEKKGFTIVTDLKSAKQLSSIINSKEMGILSGAIKMLCKVSKAVINGGGFENKAYNLKEVQFNFTRIIQKSKHITIN